MLHVYKRTWRPGDGTAFCHLHVTRRNWWTLYFGWFQVEFYKPK